MSLTRTALVTFLVITAACNSSLKLGVIASEPAHDFSSSIEPILKTYCYSCHAEGASEGSFSFDSFADSPSSPAVLESWWKVLKNVRSGVMPPKGEKRPNKEEIAAISNWIKFSKFGIDANNIDPGRPVIRRLNRSEYGATVSDLMGIPFDAAVIFPPDDSGYGFDNVGDALTMSPLLMEKYVRSAQSVVDRAVPKTTWLIPYQEFPGSEFRSATSEARGNNLPGKTPVKVTKTFDIEDAGQYEMLVSVKLHGSFAFDPGRYDVALSVDGAERSRNEYGWDENKLQRYSFREEWTTGKHEIAFELTPKKLETPETEPPAFSFDNEPRFVRFEIVSVRIEGPAGTSKRVHPKGYERFFSRGAPPETSEARRQYASELLSKFASRAFRSSVDDATLQKLTSIAEGVYNQPDRTFEEGIAQAMVAILASPRFLFRLEGTGAAPDSEQFSPIDELALATRLSYFLWSTLPDEELLELAEKGELRTNLRQQVDRMLKHPRGANFVRSFAGQWLRTRDVTQISIDPIVILGYQDEFEKMREKFRDRRARPTTRELSPEDRALRDRFRELRSISDRFGEELRRAIRQETELCVEHLARENGSLLDLLDADYTFLNEKLAELYGIPDVRGPEMRKVTLPVDSPRGGVLTQASMLLVTSNPTRTSPVKRGLFVLDNILGMPSPPAPPNVPELEEAAKQFAGREPSLREMLAAHREKAICTSCHARMDPLGLALENFNALGMWRDMEKDQPIDAAGELITGESFRDIRELKKILREHHAEDFYRCVTQKMLTFALGRGLDFGDEHTVDLVVERLNQSGGKFNDLIDGVVESAPFQKQRNPAYTAKSTATSTANGAKP